MHAITLFIADVGAVDGVAAVLLEVVAAQPSSASVCMLPCTIGRSPQACGHDAATPMPLQSPVSLHAPVCICLRVQSLKAERPGPATARLVAAIGVRAKEVVLAQAAVLG